VPTVRHTDYIGSWLEVLRDDNRAIVRAASAASKAADYLLAFRRDAGDRDGRPSSGPTILHRRAVHAEEIPNPRLSNFQLDDVTSAARVSERNRSRDYALNRSRNRFSSDIEFLPFQRIVD
jgi:hypothetical protein